MRRGSLHLRLMLGGAVAILAALAAAWLAMTWLFGRHVERRETTELLRNAVPLVASLRLEPPGRPRIDQPPTDTRFSSPAGGLYWQVSTTHGSARSRSLWDQALPASPNAAAGEWRSRMAQGPFGGRVLLLERTVQPDRHDPPVLVQVAVDNAPLNAARQEFGRELAGFLAVLWTVLSAAALLQVRLGLSPLRRLSVEVERLRRSHTARLSGDHPREVAPLIAAINGMAGAREAELLRARRRAADLAHSLKTPLAAMAAQSRQARELGAVSAADGLDRGVAAISAALESELARSRAAALRQSGTPARSHPATVVERLIAVLERTDHGAAIVFSNEVPDELVASAPEDALTELLGAVLENATRHARRRVRVTGEPLPQGGVRLEVGDDGPGLDADRMEAALIRGGRLDEAGPGHGLGLAIVRDLMQATEGEIELGRASLGGLAVRLSWPTAAD